MVLKNRYGRVLNLPRHLKKSPDNYDSSNRIIFCVNEFGIRGMHCYGAKNEAATLNRMRF